MNALTRWDPVREIQSMRNLMDRFFEESFMDAPRLWSRSLETFAPALDVMEDSDAYTVTASVPGVDPEAIDVTLTENVLTIKGETKSEEEKKEANYHLRERRFGRFSRSITLPTPVDADHIEATQENGVLTLRLPKVESAKPKRIEIKPTVNGHVANGHG